MALNLACAFADRGSRTLLVDGSMRRPALARVIGIPPSPGLAEVFTEKSVWSDAVAQTLLPKLHVVPAGATGEDSSLLLRTPKLVEFMQAVSEAYDLVIVDAESVLLVSDSLVLAPRMDGIVLVAALGASAKGDLSRAIDLLARSKGRVLGVVANRRPTSRP